MNRQDVPGAQSTTAAPTHDAKDTQHDDAAQPTGGASSPPLSRRSLLQGAALVAVAAGAGIKPRVAHASGLPGTVLAEPPADRAHAAFVVRRRAARDNRDAFPLTQQPINDDEVRFGDFRGNYSKTLKHDALGEVNPNSYQSLLDALASRDPDDFEAILVGRPDDPLRNRLVSPQAAYAFELSGLDGNAGRIPAAPAVDSDVTEAEMAELYWYSVTRDVPFSEYETRNKISRAADDLNTFTRKDIFPRDAYGDVTPLTLFRGTIPVIGAAPGVLAGPFVSQFLLLPFQIGQLEVEQRYRKLERGAPNQFMTTFQQWRKIQRGYDPNANDPSGNASTFKSGRKYIARMRDLSEWVHRDFPLQSPMHALSVILGLGDDNAFDPNLPYLRVNSATQQGFVTFGLADISQLATMAPRQALAAAWFQKWACHRRLRPEQYGARLNVQLRGAKAYGLGEGELLGSDAFQHAVDEIRAINGTPGDSENDGLLPMGFPEGSPAHPAYPGGHSTFIAAGATMLKAFVDESYEFPAPMVPNQNGSELLPWTGAPLTLGGELNKLVANITHARDAAGMHWRSDGVGNLIGEAAAIALLADYSRAHTEEFDGLTLTRFDGQEISIQNGTVTEI
ncbi:MAG: twin-arginine translocation signal domain-containing protein [Myxococcales bacterium]|nr:twin-arginine translocation signal domain-containing protein [Myxococcales bacterium]